MENLLAAVARQYATEIAALLGRGIALARSDGTRLATALPPVVETDTVLTAKPDGPEVATAPPEGEERTGTDKREGVPSAEATQAVRTSPMSATVEKPDTPSPTAPDLFEDLQWSPVCMEGKTVCLLALLPDTEDRTEVEPVETEEQTLLRAIGILTGMLAAAGRERRSAATWWSARDRFLEEWLFSAYLPDDKALEARGRQLGIDVNRIRSAGMLLLEPSTDPENGEAAQAEDYPRMIADILDRLRGGGGREVLATALGNRIAVLFETDSLSVAREHLAAARERIEEACPAQVYGGVGMPRRQFSEMPESMREAERAARNARSTRTRAVLAFGDIALELFLQEVPARVWREFRSRVLRGIPEAEIASWTRLLAVYFQTGGALGEAAARLGIHKNTLQYRLRRLAEITGHDPRRLRDALSLYLATMMDTTHNQG